MIAKGDVFGFWKVREVDALGKRAACECSRCSARRLIAVESLKDGSAKSCDCRPPPIADRVSRYVPASFANKISRDVVAFGPRPWRGR